MGGAGGKPSGSGGGSGGGFTSGSKPYQTGGSFWDINPRSIAGLNPFQQRAGRRAGNIGRVGGGNLNDAQRYLRTLAGRGGNQMGRRSRGAADFFTQLGEGNDQFNTGTRRLLHRLSGGDPSGYINRGIRRAGRYGRELPSEFTEGADLSRRLTEIGSRQVTGENLANDPALRAAQQRFSASQLPLIQNQAALMGLGDSSTLASAAAHGNAQAMTPMILDALSREERGIGRELASTGEAAQNLFGIGRTRLGENAQSVNALLQGAGQESSNLLNAIGGRFNLSGQRASELAQGGAGLAGLAGQDSANLANAASGSAALGGQRYGQNANTINILDSLGDRYRGVEQEQLDAPYNEQRRVWGEALNAMYGPLGFLGNMGGATSTQSKK